MQDLSANFASNRRVSTPTLQTVNPVFSSLFPMCSNAIDGNCKKRIWSNLRSGFWSHLGTPPSKNGDQAYHKHTTPVWIVSDLQCDSTIHGEQVQGSPEGVNVDTSRMIVRSALQSDEARRQVQQWTACHKRFPTLVPSACQHPQRRGTKPPTIWHTRPFPFRCWMTDWKNTRHLHWQPLTLGGFLRDGSSVDSIPCLDWVRLCLWCQFLHQLRKLER